MTELHSTERAGATPARATLVSLLALCALGIACWAWKADAFIADDSYFYLVTARRFVLEGRQTFSGAFLTNGVHPLWFYLLSLYDLAVAHVAPTALFHPAGAVPLSAALLVVGTVLLARGAQRHGWNAFAVTAPVAAFVTSMGVLFSEAHALYAAAALVLWRFGSPRVFASLRDGALTGLCLGLLFLARLDSCFLVAALVVLRWREHAEERKAIVAAAGAAALLVLPYLAVNVVYFGGLAPVSGWLKSSFPVPHPHGLELWGGLNVLLSGYNVPFGVVPILFALLVWATVPAARRSREYGALLVGCLAHFAYTALFAEASSWYWYYVLDVLLGVLALHLVATARGWGKAAVALAAGAALAGALLLVRKPSLRPQIEAAPIMRFLAEQPLAHATLLVSEAPGQIAFYTRHNVLVTDMLTANRALYGRLAASANPFAELLRASAEAGYPLDYVAWNDGAFLLRAPDGRTLELQDPKGGRHERSFGAVTFPAPVRHEPRLIVWPVPREVSAKTAAAQ